MTTLIVLPNGVTNNPIPSSTSVGNPFLTVTTFTETISINPGGPEIPAPSIPDTTLVPVTIGTTPPADPTPSSPTTPLPTSTPSSTNPGSDISSDSPTTSNSNSGSNSSGSNSSGSNSSGSNHSASNSSAPTNLPSSSSESITPVATTIRTTSTVTVDKTADLHSGNRQNLGMIIGIVISVVVVILVLLGGTLFFWKRRQKRRGLLSSPASEGIVQSTVLSKTEISGAADINATMPISHPSPNPVDLSDSSSPNPNRLLLHNTPLSMTVRVPQLLTIGDSELEPVVARTTSPDPGSAATTSQVQPVSLLTTPFPHQWSTSQNPNPNPNPNNCNYSPLAKLKDGIQIVAFAWVKGLYYCTNVTVKRIRSGQYGRKTDFHLCIPEIKLHTTHVHARMSIIASEDWHCYSRRNMS